MAKVELEQHAGLHRENRNGEVVLGGMVGSLRFVGILACEVIDQPRSHVGPRLPKPTGLGK
jgi:hypothetical protein